MQLQALSPGPAMKGSVCRVGVFRSASLRQPHLSLSTKAAESSVPAPVVPVAAKKGFGTPKAAPRPKPQVPTTMPDPCPCESGKAYKNCCQPAHEGTKPAATLEAAIRARFSAFTRGDEAYILKTTHSSYADFHYLKPMAEAKDQLVADVHTACTGFEFIDLKVQKSELGPGPDEGAVAFQYKSGPKGSTSDTFDTTNEKTRFVLEDGVWLFADYQRFQFNASSVFSNVEQVSMPPKA